MDGNQPPTDPLGLCLRVPRDSTLDRSPGQVRQQLVFVIRQVPQPSSQFLGTVEMVLKVRSIRGDCGLFLGLSRLFIAQPSGLVKPRCKEAAGLDKEVPASTGWVQHLELENLAGVRIFLRAPLGTLWPE